MKKYNVIVHYEGAIGIEVDAENEEKAEELAKRAFDEISDAELIANLADIDICDCFEIE